ncbi:MAG: ACP S-malonyltransferase [Gammaproteobacteria bacterium]|nr:ACP S-malonyltransferase [Gammaproteobacteria bacterium]
MSIAVVFPGQGSQAVGMLAELGNTYPVIKQTVAEASKKLDYDLWELMQAGPEERLNSTAHTQPALLAAGVAIWRLWESQAGPGPAYMAGHSLGEYTALVCAGALDFATAIQLVEFRGVAMQAAVPAGTGAMAAVLGLEDQAVMEACRTAADGQVVAPANYNAPGQVVIAGHRQAVDRAGQTCKQRGAKRVIPLAVSVPSHCALMRPAAEQLGARLSGTTFQPPAIPVLHNQDVSDHADAEGIRKALTAQLYSPVRWVETVRFLASHGVTQLVEMGPGGVLAGLGRRIDKSLKTCAVDSPANLASALAQVHEV